MKDQKFVSVVLRVSNTDLADLGTTLRRIDDVISARFSAYEIILVNDSGSDTLPGISDAITQTRGAVIILEMAYDQGLETAMIAGIDRAMGDFVFEIDDCRVDYPIEILNSLYETAQAGNDIVSAVPQRVPFSTRLLYWMCNHLSSLAPPLYFERVRISSRRAVDALLRQPERVRYRQVLYRHTGYRYASVPYQSNDQSLLRPKGRLTFGIDMFWSFSGAVGAWLSRVLGIVFTIVSSIALVVALIRTPLDPWWVLLAVIALFGFAGLFVLFTVTNELLSLILGEVRNRPLYTLDRTLTRTFLRSSPLTVRDAPDQTLALSERNHALQLVEPATALPQTSPATPPSRPDDAEQTPTRPAP